MVHFRSCYLLTYLLTYLLNIDVDIAIFCQYTPGLTRGAVKSPNFRDFRFKKTANFTDKGFLDFFILLSCNLFNKGHIIGGFRDTYLGRQVVLRPGGPRAGMGSAGVWERCELP